MANIGDQLPNPESGWIRLDDDNSNIIYSSTGWLLDTEPTSYNGYRHKCARTTVDPYITFTLPCTQFRVISANYSTYSNSIQVKIDGSIVGTYSQVSGSSGSMDLLYESPVLSNGYHIIELKKLVAGAYTYDFFLDAIDYIKSSPVIGSDFSALSSLNIGDGVFCEYTASAQLTGLFANLGSATKALIPITSSATPDGKFKFIKVAKGLLIADRNIQHSISWDTINDNMFAQGMSVTVGTIKCYIRIPTGGSAWIDSYGNAIASDQELGAWTPNNEWDTYVRLSTLDGTITAGDNNVWNYNVTGITNGSWVQNTQIVGIAANTQRVSRGGTTSVQQFSNIVSSTANNTRGFRPVLEYKEDGSPLW